MVATRVLVVSDSHLSSRTPEAVANWDSVVAHIAADEPDIVVHAGDVSTDGAEVVDDLAFARAQLERCVRPLYVLAGNHDLGDNPHTGNPLPTAAVDCGLLGVEGEGPGSGSGTGEEPTDTGRSGREPLICAERLARYRDHLAPDRWTVDITGWRLIGLNALLFDSRLDDEDDQWAWLDDQVGDVDRRQRIGVFVHKPVVSTPDRPDDSSATSPGRYVPPSACERLLGVGARLFVSGHTHQFCRHRTDGTTHVWVPSTWAVIPDRFQTTLGDKVCGVVELVLHDDGTCESELILPYGIVQHAIVDDVPNPYTHG